ncbi:MAG: putative RNA binding protein YcfA (HicA-like mRNA interferase family) [Cocleimonas sp.]|jgi:predicted RNA binding protein YcfA (HicA-like mRNA interferase family)
MRSAELIKLVTKKSWVLVRVKGILVKLQKQAGL